MGGGVFPSLHIDMYIEVVRNHCFQQMHQRPNSSRRGPLGPMAYKTQKELAAGGGGEGGGGPVWIKGVTREGTHHAQ